MNNSFFSFKKNVCIVVFIYKQYFQLTANELASLNQLFSIIYKQEICLYYSEDIEITNYLNLSKKYNNSISTLKSNNKNFISVQTYSSLLISKQFYESFDKYKFILIYQLDAYLFKDEIDYWCNKNYDYIGAPWTGTHYYNGELLLGVGNGGLSLRKVRSFIVLLNKIRIQEVLMKYEAYSFKGILSNIFKISFEIIKSKKVQSNLEKKISFQEDIFWCVDIKKLLIEKKFQSVLLSLLRILFCSYSFKIPCFIESLKFSFETKPEELYTLNNEELPFGCHAWEKYEPDFWKSFIPVAVNSVNV